MSSSERSKTSAAEQVTEYNIHIPVLLTEVLSFVRTDIPNMVIVDMTIGRAGHSSNILEMVDNTASLYGFDRDPAALSYSDCVVLISFLWISVYHHLNSMILKEGSLIDMMHLSI